MVTQVAPAGIVCRRCDFADAPRRWRMREVGEQAGAGCQLSLAWRGPCALKWVYALLITSTINSQRRRTESQGNACACRTPASPARVLWPLPPLPAPPPGPWLAAPLPAAAAPDAAPLPGRPTARARAPPRQHQPAAAAPARDRYPGGGWGAIATRGFRHSYEYAPQQQGGTLTRWHQSSHPS